MKKIFIALCAFAAVIGCQKAEMEQPQENDGVKVPLKITASIAQTKTTMTNEDGVLKSAWKDGDKIYVRLIWGNAIDGTVEFTASVSGSSVDFVTESEGVTINQEKTSQYNFVAEYPLLGFKYSGYVNTRYIVVPANQIQSAPGDLTHISETNPLYAQPVKPADWSADVFSLNFEMKHALSVLQLNLKGEEQGIKIATIKVEMLDDSDSDSDYLSGNVMLDQSKVVFSNDENGGSNAIQLNLASEVELPTDSEAQFYMTISPGHAGKTFKVTAATETGETIEVGSMKVPADGEGIPRGVKAVKSFTVKAPVKEEIDYNSAIDLSADGTANCYVVNKANTLYKFNAQVMGNGVAPASLSDAGTAIAPKSALVLWYSPISTSSAWENNNPVVQGSVELRNGYVYFRTPSEFVAGNVVIAVFAEEGLNYNNIEADSDRKLTNATILWSWNLWCVEDYSPEKETVKVGDYTIMNRNLGALINGLDISTSVPGDCYRASYAIGNHYQMGRKDPMPSHFGYNSYSPSYCQDWTPNFTPITALQQTGGVMFNDGSDLNHYDNSTIQTLNGTLECAVRQPYLFMSGSTGIPFTYSWYPKEDNKYCKDLWGDTTTEANDEVKTMYDPCPDGWMVWTSDAVDALWDSCSGLSYEVKANGVYVGNDMCFPFNGVRADNNGKGEIIGHLAPYTSWGQTGAAKITGSVYSSYLTSTYRSGTESNPTEHDPYIYSATLEAVCQNGSIPSVNFKKYDYISAGSLHHQRAARSVRCMKE